jgi:hypothetical protein
VGGREVYPLRKQGAQSGIELEADLGSLPDGYLFRDDLAEVLPAILGVERHVRTQGEGHGERGLVPERAPVGREGDGEQRNEFLELLEHPRDGRQLFAGADTNLLKFVLGSHTGAPSIIRSVRDGAHPYASERSTRLPLQGGCRAYYSS